IAAFVLLVSEIDVVSCWPSGTDRESVVGLAPTAWVCAAVCAICGDTMPSGALMSTRTNSRCSWRDVMLVWPFGGNFRRAATSVHQHSTGRGMVSRKLVARPNLAEVFLGCTPSFVEWRTSSNAKHTP